MVTSTFYWNSRSFAWSLSALELLLLKIGTKRIGLTLPNLSIKGTPHPTLPMHGLVQNASKTVYTPLKVASHISNKVFHPALILHSSPDYLETRAEQREGPTDWMKTNKQSRQKTNKQTNTQHPPPPKPGEKWEKIKKKRRGLGWEDGEEWGGNWKERGGNDQRAIASSFLFLLTPWPVSRLHKLSHQEQSTQGLTEKHCKKRPRAEETPLRGVCAVRTAQQMHRSLPQLYH